MPSSWFFDIYEDSPDEEAAIFMEHSAAILDISSDDEEEVKKRASEELGKENVPPEGFVPATWARGMVDAGLVQAQATEEEKSDVVLSKLKALRDEMEVEVDRKPLRVLALEDFYPKSEQKEDEEEEWEEEEYEDEDEEKVWAKSSVGPSGLSKEFSFSVEAREEGEAEKEIENAPVEQHGAATIVPATDTLLPEQQPIQNLEDKDVPTPITPAPEAQPALPSETVTSSALSAVEPTQDPTVSAA